MSAGETDLRRSAPSDLVSELKRGPGRPAEIARRLGPEWSEDDVRAGLAELFSDGVVGHNHGIGFWWTA